MNPDTFPVLGSLLSATPTVSITSLPDILGLVDFINQSSFEFGSVSSNQFGHIKCLAPSLDYPCLTSTYLLVPPFKVYWSTPTKFVKPNLYIPTPKLITSWEMGESDLVLNRLKDSLISAILKYKHFTVPLVRLP